MKKLKKRILNLSLICLVIIILSVSGFADATLHSSTALDTIFQQTEGTYLKALGSNKQDALNNAPEVFATLVGLTMQQQFEQLRDYKNREYLSRFEALQDEALTFMGQLAQAHSYRHPADGSNMPADRLTAGFYNGRNMNTSNVRFGNLNPADVKLPFILSQVELPDNTGVDEYGKIQVKPNNEINFLGVVAPPAESSYGQSLVGIHPPTTPQKISAEMCQECPKRQPGKNSTNNTYCDNGGRLICTYFEDGRLSSQMPKLNGKWHGIHLDHEIERGIYYLKKQSHYINDKRHGLSTQYSLSSSGQPYLSSRLNCSEGQTMLNEKFGYHKSTGHYLKSVYKYNPATGYCDLKVK